MLARYALLGLLAQRRRLDPGQALAQMLSFDKAIMHREATLRAAVGEAGMQSRAAEMGRLLQAEQGVARAVDFVTAQAPAPSAPIRAELVAGR